MSKVWPKVIRDPVHNIIPFEDNDCDRLMLNLINAKEFQRLRRIKQLGMSELVFPGSNHSRFAHSVGVMHVARRMFDRIRMLSTAVKDEHRIVVVAAALLHDIGHGPFSHAFEKVTGQKHEARTMEIIRNRRTEVGKCLRKHDPNLPDRLAIFFDEDIDAQQGGSVEIPKYLTQIVSSQLDADRFDYLLRDSYATGAEYGRYDMDWLLLQLMLDAEKSRLVLGRKAADAAEAYIFARYHMHRAVYFHKTVRAAEVMVRLTLMRFKELVKQAGAKANQRQIMPDSPASVFAAFSSDRLDLGSYLALDDCSLTEFFKACAGANDGILKSLGTGIVQRTLYKSIDITDRENTEEFAGRVYEMLKKKRKDRKYCFVYDAAGDTPYEQYDPDSENPASEIYIQSAAGQTIEISRQMKALKQLQEPYKLRRYYFPEDLRGPIDKIARETLGKEGKA